MAEPRFRILAISGSLRVRSNNTAVLAALGSLVPPAVRVVLYDGLRTIPPFDPDQDTAPPEPIVALRAAVAAADALVIASPEYARGIAGALKNALDWLVGGPELPGKRVALVNTSPRAIHGPAALRLTLETMSATLVEAACVTLPLLGRALDADAIAADPALATPLRQALTALAARSMDPARVEGLVCQPLGPADRCTAHASAENTTVPATIVALTRP